MKATLEIPDELYALVKARAALEGRTLRSVAIELLSQWVRGDAVAGGTAPGVEEGKPEYKVGGDDSLAGKSKEDTGPLSATGDGEARRGAPYPWEIFGERLRKKMRYDAPIDEIAGVLKGDGPELDMAKAREMYMQEIAEAWKKRGV